MYCVKCGVKLQEGTEKCPLCGTPVWNPDGLSAESTYSSRMPDKTFDRDPFAAFLTVLIVLADLLLFFVIAVLPFWFRDPNPVIFLPIDTVALELFLLFLCLRTGGHWFMSFAFPCAGIMGIIGTATAALLKYLRKGRYIVIGGLQIILGAFCILLEFFQHITFDTAMFRWSLFATIALFVSGTFLICVGLIRPLREFVNRVFYI